MSSTTNSSYPSGRDSIRSHFESSAKSSSPKNSPSRFRTQSGPETKRLRMAQDPENNLPDGKISLIRNNQVIGSIAAKRLDLNTMGSSDFNQSEYIKLRVGEGENESSCLVSVESIRNQIFSAVNAGNYEGQGITPGEVIQFLKDHQEVASSASSASYDALSALNYDFQDGQQQILGLMGLGMSKDEAELIVNFVKSNQYKSFPGYKVGETMHIRRNVVDPPLKCSMVIKEDGSALLLLKGKENLKNDVLLRKAGHFKSVKTALDLNTGKIVAHTTIDITAHAQARVESRLAINFSQTPPDESQRAEIEIEKSKIINEIKKECNFLRLFSGIETNTFCTYLSVPTKPGEEPHMILSFASTLALDDLAGARDSFVRNPEQLVAGLIDVATCVSAMHDQNKVHRDIKLENILVLKLGNILKLHLADFELCAEVEVAKGERKGQKRLMAPEVYEALINNKVGTPDPKKADVFELGLAFLRLLTGSGLPITDTIVDGEDRLSQLAEASDKLSLLDHLKDNLQQSKDMNENSVRGVLEDLGSPNELTDLLVGMLNVDADARLDIHQVLEKLGSITPDMMPEIETLGMSPTQVDDKDYFKE